MGIWKSEHTEIDDQSLRQVLLKVEEYLDENYAFRREQRYQGFLGSLRAAKEIEAVEEQERLTSQERKWELNVRFSDPFAAQEYYKEYKEKHQKDNFSNNLMALIQQKNLDHVSVYKNARVDRKLFSKIKTDIDYIPSKKTILALAIGMKLDFSETEYILNQAGFHLADTILFDVIVGFFIKSGIYDLDEINSVLFEFKQQTF